MDMLHKARSLNQVSSSQWEPLEIFAGNKSTQVCLSLNFCICKTGWKQGKGRIYLLGLLELNEIMHIEHLELFLVLSGASLVAQMLKNLPAMQETWVWSLGWEDPLEKGMATHSNILAWRIPWAEEPGGLQSMELQRVRHDWLTKLSLFLGT